MGKMKKILFSCVICLFITTGVNADECASSMYRETCERIKRIEQNQQVMVRNLEVIKKALQLLINQKVDSRYRMEEGK